MASLLSQIAAFLPVFLASPTMYAGMLVILTSPNRPKAQAAAAWVGSVLTLIVIGFVAVGAGGAATSPRQPTTLSGTIDVILGVLLIFFGLKRALKKPEPGPKPEPKPKAEPASAAPKFTKSMGLGIMLTIVNPTSMVAYLAAAKIIADSKVAALDQAVAMAVAGLFYSSPILLPLLLTLLSPNLSERFLAGADHVFKTYGKYIVAAILILFGLSLVSKGLKIN
ncbi:MAG: GAP family protein [Actinomycetota bacterium]|nr:GAP family protein [Actinomycetota bacterium]